MRPPCVTNKLEVTREVANDKWMRMTVTLGARYYYTIKAVSKSMRSKIEMSVSSKKRIGRIVSRITNR